MQDKSLGSRYIDMSKLLADQQQSKEHRLMPEYIEKFFVEAYRSFGGTITPGQGQEGRLVDQPCAARSPQAARADGASVRQDRRDLPPADVRQGTGRRLLRPGVHRAWPSACSRAWWSGS